MLKRTSSTSSKISAFQDSSLSTRISFAKNFLPSLKLFVQNNRYRGGGGRRRQPPPPPIHSKFYSKNQDYQSVSPSDRTKSNNNEVQELGVQILVLLMVLKQKQDSYLAQTLLNRFLPVEVTACSRHWLMLLSSHVKKT
jgi:hypothetical protein